MPSASEDLTYEALKTMSDKKIGAKVMINNEEYICRVETRGEYLIRLEEEAMARAEAVAKAEAEAAEAAEATEAEAAEAAEAAAKEEEENTEDEGEKPKDEFGASRIQSSGAISAMVDSNPANTFSRPPSVKSGVSTATTVSASPAVQAVKKPSMCDV